MASEGGGVVPSPQTKVATAPAGSSWESERPFSVIENRWAEEAVFTTYAAREPSGLRKTTFCTPPGPWLVEPIRTAPGSTNFVRWPRTWYSAPRVTRSPAISTTPLHRVPQWPWCGPPFASRARFQVITVSPPLRMLRTTRFSACQRRVSAKVAAGSALSVPEHSVKKTRLPAWRIRSWASGEPP